METLSHAYRVMGYVTMNVMIPKDKADDCIALAIMHDLIEDTEYHMDETKLDPHFCECLTLLTKPKFQVYVEYIKNIRKHAASHEEAYWVKIADMKDHLSQRDTLTEKLRDKYVNALPYLL